MDETALKEIALRLRGAEAAPVPIAPTSEADEVHWVPQLADDMTAAFLDECTERIEGLSGRLLLLEQRGPIPDLVGEIFRDLHTLKGSSAFAGLKKLNRVAHRAEDLIGQIRDGKRGCDRAVIDVPLETLDVLRAIVDLARARAPIALDISTILARLDHPRAPAKVAAPAVAKAAAPAPVQQATLRIDFAKVDQLLNLVGEVVLARGRMGAATEAQAPLLREFAALRKQHPDSALAEELLRAERVLSRDLRGARRRARPSTWR
ncbi:MAG: Hpt domain-containing protein [Comamonadaceae bacterium]|nr:Hpt domain-containing protein [Comamonadaceae bacterium]